MAAPAEYNEFCPFCRMGPYKSLSGLLKHIKIKHSEEPDLEEKKRGLPKAPRTKCPRCGKDMSNMSDHKKRCVQARPDVVAAADHAEFVAQFETRLSLPIGGSCTAKTIELYALQLRKFLDCERRVHPDFKPSDWFDFGNKARFKMLRDVRNYVDVGGEGNPTSKIKSTVYAKLIAWIEEAYRQWKGDISSLIEANKTSNAKFHKDLKAGKVFHSQAAATASASTSAAAGTPPPAAADTSTGDMDARSRAPGRDFQHSKLDPALTERLLRAWQRVYSRVREEAFTNFGAGNYRVPSLGLDLRGEPVVGTREKALAFMALAIYMQNGGIRPEAVFNMTYRELKAAAHEVVMCPYCQETVIYADHKGFCDQRAAAQTAAVESGVAFKDLGDRKAVRYLVRVHNHKTKTKYPYVEVFMEGDELDTCLRLCTPQQDQQDPPPPFKQVVWQGSGMHSILRGMVRKEEGGEELWRQALSKKETVGAFEFKRLDITKTRSKAKSDAEVSRLMTAIGTSVEMGRVVYDEARERSRIRGEHLRDTNNFQSRADEPGPSSMVRSSTPPPGPAVVAVESDPGNDSDSDREELANAREAADRLYAERLQQDQGDQDPVSEVPKVVPDGNLSFWTKFATFLDRFGTPEHEKETRVTYVRGFCQHHSLAIQDLLQWSDLDVAPVDVPPSEDWLAGFGNSKDKELAADAYELLLQFLSTLIPSEEGASDEEDKEAIGDRNRVIEALMSRHRNSNLYQGKGKGKGQGKNSCKD